MAKVNFRPLRSGVIGSPQFFVLRAVTLRTRLEYTVIVKGWLHSSNRFSYSVRLEMLVAMCGIVLKWRSMSLALWS